MRSEREALTDSTLKLFVELCKEKIAEEQNRQGKGPGSPKNAGLQSQGARNVRSRGQLALKTSYLNYIKKL